MSEKDKLFKTIRYILIFIFLGPVFLFVLVVLIYSLKIMFANL